MDRRSHIRLALIANSDAKALQRTVDSVRHLIDSALVVIAPRAYTSLPAEGFGYCALETRVVQSPALATMTRDELVTLATEAHVDWVMTLAVGDVVPVGVRVSDLELDLDGARFEILPGVHLVRARRAHEGT